MAREKPLASISSWDSFTRTTGKISVLGYERGDVRAKQKTGFVPENCVPQTPECPEVAQVSFGLGGRRHDQVDRLIRDLLFKVQLQGYERLRLGSIRVEWCSGWGSRRRF